MSLLAALVLALLGALGTAWIIWLRREAERDVDALTMQVTALAAEVAALAAEVAALRGSVEGMRAQMSVLRGAAEATRAELTEFVHGPPSIRRPMVTGA
jgi:hypothetical protein